MIQHDANGRFAEQDRLARFMEKICPEPMSGCWLWLAAINMHGYGTFRWNAVRRMTAHQAAFELFRGPRGGLEVLHHCDVRCCANPEHLYLGTQIENTLDAVSRGRWVRPPRPAAENIPRGDNHWTRRRGVTSFATTREHLHGQAGAAPNCAELHLVLDVEAAMTLGCCAICGCVEEVRGQGRTARVVGHGSFATRHVEYRCSGSGQFPMLPMRLRQPVANDNRSRRLKR